MAPPNHVSTAHRPPTTTIANGMTYAGCCHRIPRTIASRIARAEVASASSPAGRRWVRRGPAGGGWTSGGELTGSPGDAMDAEVLAQPARSKTEGALHRVELGGVVEVEQLQGRRGERRMGHHRGQQPSLETGQGHGQGKDHPALAHHLGNGL